MDNFKNVTREFYEREVSYIASNICKCKKKDLIKKLEAFSNDEDCWAYINKYFALRGMFLTTPKEVTDYVYAFGKAKRYFVADTKSITEQTTNLDFLDNLFEDDCNFAFIETEISNNMVVLLCERFSKPIVCGPVLLGYKITQYIGVPSIPSITYLASTYVTYDLSGLIRTIPSHTKRSCKVPTEIATIDGDKRDCITAETPDNSKAIALLYLIEKSVDVACYVGKCIKNRYSLTRKNGKVAKEYERAKVHVATTESKTDTLVLLHKYAKEYSYVGKRESKGGHHKSPIAHDRTGFYRKSRGAGDYEYINGEFVFVGDKKGHYSWVRATRVTGKKANVIYKV